MLTEEDLQAIDSPLLKDGKIPPTMHIALGPQRKLVAYPCRGSTVMNCGAFIREKIYIPQSPLINNLIHTADSELHEMAADKWMAKGDPNALLESYKDFDPLWTGIIK
jgi:hypothetical protein